MKRRHDPARRAVLLLVLIPWSCGKPPVTASQTSPVRVRVQTATWQVWPEKIRASGTLVPVEKTAVTAKVEGRLRILMKRLGDRVAQGELLAELEKDQAELEVRKAQVELRQALAAVKLAEARHLEAGRRVENNLVAASRAEDGVTRREISLGNRRRILSNQSVLLVQGGVPRDRVETLDAEIRQEELDLVSARKELVMLRRGFRDEDFTEAGLPIPLDPKERLVGMKEMGTRVEAAEVEQAKGAMAAAELRLEAARMALAECTVRSPRGGVVAARSYDPGEEVSRQNPIYVILETGILHASVNLGEGDHGRILPGQKALLFPPAVTGTNEDPAAGIPGEVDLLAPMLDPGSRTGEVRLRTASRPDLKPGMAIRVVIDTGRTVKSVRLPAVAVEFGDGAGGKGDGATFTDGTEKEGHVWLVVSGAAVRRKVLALPPRQGPVDITAGLAEGDAVVVEGMESLREGQAVVE